MKKISFSIIIITIFGLYSGYSQTKPDSLTRLVSVAKNDTAKLSLYLQLGLEYKKLKPDTALYFFDKVRNSKVKHNEYHIAKAYFEIAVFQLEIRENKNQADSLFDISTMRFREILQDEPESNVKQIELSIAKSLYYKARIARSLQNQDIALCYTDTSLKIYTQSKDSSAIISVNILRGNIYLDLSAYDKALKCFFISLELAEKMKDNNYIARNLNNIGYVYFWMKDYDKALAFWEKSLEISKILKSDMMVGKIILNIGNIYNQNKKYDTALNYYEDALEILLKLKDKNGIILSYNNIGNVYINQKRYTEALGVYQKGLEFCEKIADTTNLALIYNNISNLYFDKNEYQKSIHFANQALLCSQRVSDLQKQYSAYLHLYDSYNELGNFEKALEYYKHSTKLKDSIFNQEKVKSIQDLDIKYKTQKKEQENTLLRKDKTLKEVTIQKQRTVVFMALIVLVLVLITLVILFISRRKLKKYTNLLVEQREIILQQNEEIQAQADSLQDTNEALKNLNAELKYKSEQITSSIRYAKTIQNAILPAKEQVDADFDSFVIFRPKDIVSGDFYWYKKVETTTTTYIFIGIFDCTGHGVPGAFMSMIGNTLLNEIVNSKRIFEVDQILENMNTLIKASLRQELTDNSDGMDACFCRIEKTKDATVLNYAGAKLPLFYFNAEKNEVEIIDGIRRSIGGYRYNKNPEKFLSTEIHLHSNDSIYLSSDGISDQNNSERKRFGKSQLIEILIENSKKSLEDQKMNIETNLDLWMENTEQRDDITLIGLKF